MAPPSSLPLLHKPLQPRARTSSVVAAILHSYRASLSAQSLALSQHHVDLISDFLTTLVAYDNLSETILPPAELLTTSIPHSLHVGTGLSVTQTIASAIASAQHSVIFCTCFWAASPSRDVFADALRQLSACGRRVSVRIGFSSSSASQKLFHTSSALGKTHEPSSWPSFGLPAAEEILNLDMSVKSIFFLPFSVLHSKFCIIDDRLLLLPSANISWEVWLEQCTTFSGSIVHIFTKFWERVWSSGDHTTPPSLSSLPPQEGISYPTIFLPQPHHRNPSFSPIPSLLCCLSQRPAAPPSTPQNSFLVHLLSRARHSIYLQTPNLTSQPLLRALKTALSTGVNVELVTCRRMMVLEQLVTTAGSASTEGSVDRLVSFEERMRARRGGGRLVGGGALRVWYYTGAGDDAAEDASAQDGVTVSPTSRGAVKSHVKALIVDGEVTVLGSANADRASWYTSQEVNVAVFSAAFAVSVKRGLATGLGGRVERLVGAMELGEVVGMEEDR